MQLLNKPSDRHQGNFGPGCGHPGKVWHKEKTKSSLFIKESVKVPGMGPGRATHDYVGDLYSRTATGQKTLNTGQGHI